MNERYTPPKLNEHTIIVNDLLNNAPDSIKTVFYYIASLNCICYTSKARDCDRYLKRSGYWVWGFRGCLKLMAIPADKLAKYS